MADTWGENDKPVKAASNQNEIWGEGDSAVPASGLRKVGDLGLSVAKGVVAVPEALVGLADIPTGGRVGKFLENEGGAFGFRPKQAKEYLGGLQSDDLRDKQQQFQKADGIIDKAGVALSNPSLITNAVAESVPLMGAGVAPARAALAVAPKLGAVAAGAIGEGVVGAGSAAEGIRQETADGLLTPGQSGLALASGAATAGFGFAGGKLAQRLGIGDVDTMLTQGAIKTAGAPSAKSIPRQVVEGAIAEGWLEELPQSVSEQVLHNLALDKPWHEGVSDAAVMGTLAGMAMGGGAAGVSGFAQDAPPADAEQPPAAPPAPPQPQAGPALALPAPDPGVIAVGGDGTARTPAYQKPRFAGEYADVTDVVPRALAPQPADPVRVAVENAANSGGAISPAALVAIDSGVTPRQEGAFEDAPELGAQPPQINLDDITDPYDRAYYESLFDDDPAPMGAPPVLSAFLQDDDNIPDFDAANNVSEEDFLRALGADEQEIQDAIATTPDRAESAPEGAALPAGPQANVAPGTPEGAGASAEQPAGPVADAPTNLRDALAKVRAQKQEAANARAAQAPAPAAAPAPGPTGAPAVEANGLPPRGREGYDTPVTLDAASLKALVEKTRGTPLVDKPEKLEAWRNGTAKTDPAKFPIELAITPDGRLDVNDGRHRIALAAERGETVDAFIDGKDAHYAQQLVSQPSQPTGATSVPQASQTQQGSTQSTQAGGPQAGAATATASTVPAGGNRVQAAGLTNAPTSQNPGAQDTPAPGAQAQTSDKAKWIKAAVDKSRLNGGSGVQLTVTPQGEVTFSGDPRSTKEGKALLATYEEALRAGATKQEIADALMAARGQAAARPDVTLTNEGDTTPAAAEDSNANQSQTTSQQAQVATESGAPEETREQRAQRVASAGQMWTRMGAIGREALVARALGLNPIQRKRIPSAAWDDLHIDIQRKLADTIDGRVETGGSQAAAATADVQEPPSRTSESASTAPTLQSAMDAAGWTGETGKDDTIWTKEANSDTYTARLTGNSLEVTVPVNGVGTQIASMTVTDPTAAAKAASKAVADDVAESAPAPSPASPAKEAPNADGSTIVGRRADGVMIRQDKNGVRFYTDGGTRISEAVEMRPTRSPNGGIVYAMARTELKPEFMTQAERDAVSPAPAAAPSENANSRQGVVNVPRAIEASLDADMQAQKARITRLRNAATADGMSLEEKNQAQTKLKGAEFVLQKMRTTRFDAEDAAIKAIAEKDMAPFAEHIAFPRTEKALQEVIGGAAPDVNPDGRPKTASDKAMERLAAEDAADRGEPMLPAVKKAQPKAAPETAKAKKKPSADQTRAKADLMNALADLGDILGKNTRMNIMPEQEQKLLPVLTRVLDAAFRLGYHKFKDSAKFALDQIRTHLGDDAADALTLQHLQGAYVAMSGSYLSSGAESIGDVAAIRSLSELLGSTDAGVKAGAGEVQSDSFVADTELAANSRAGQPGRVQVDSEAQVEALRSVDGLMLDIGKDREILDAVVGLVPADVVNVLRGEKLTPEMLFHDPSVLVDLAGLAGDPPVAVRVNAARSVMQAAARFAAESPAPSELGWAASDFDAALDAIERRHSAIVSGDVAGGAKKVTKPGAQTLTESLYQAIGAGNMPKDNPALKKLVETFDGKPADPARMKQAQEELETAIAMSARDIVAKGQNDKATFDELLRLYESQPSLNIRTSTSVANQAYSTPAPLAFIASRLAGITRNTVAHEPTGGTGMLLIGADPKKALVNELNDLRISALKAQGFAPTQLDAATMRLVPDGVQPDAVVTNPPFGSIKDADGKPVKVKVDGYNIGQIDHLIAARALQSMKDDGKATLILGANKVAGGLSTDDRIFFNWLYSHYNVVGHFEVEGDLYARQGAGWPVRVITINGRKKSSKVAPVAGTIQRADNWSQVYEQFTQSLDAAAKPATGEVGGGPAVAIEAPGAPGGRRPKGSTGSAGNVAGTSPRVVPDRAKPAAEPVAPVPDEQRLNAQSFVPQPQPGQNPAGAERPAKPAGNAALASPAEAAGNDFQAPYVPRSARKDEGVLIPSNMAQPTQDALNRLEDAVGDIDEFARKELGYESTEALHNALMGLQVDSVATAIYQIKQGKAAVIADQTGIGKGRQAASIIRWAARNGMTPVFVSVKPSLFTDMYGDLADIGTHDVAPFILNSAEWVSGADGEKLFANKPSTHRAAIQSIVDNAALPQGRSALFMTYSQINTANLQRQALMALAPNAVFVLDESHNAAGDSGTGEFMISVLKEARGVTYLSATYAKRPDNMPLYFKTDIGDAAADSEGLANAMAAGGLPLQTVVSNNLVKAGQMFRRERSYDGVSIASTFDTANRQLHERLSDEATEALRAIVSADKMFHSVFVKSMDKALKAEGSKVQDNAGNQVSAGVQHTEFSSVVHNFVRQMLLGLKAQTAADEAIASLKRGEKPIIAVENTMGSFLSEYAAQNNINQGDSLGAFDYRTVLSRALERSRVINVVLPTGDKSKQNIPLSELDPITRKAYDQAQAVIDRLAIDIPVSPIDWMRAEIARAGFSVAEITGRDLAVDYSNPRKPVLSAIDLTEQRDKVASTRRFNGGELDALILNVAGSTGISLHASEKFADQRQRHMIVAQAAGDINIFMQMLGRVHRTGQVRLPKYTILSVDLPTEKRPTAVLSRKMKSLNANTSSNTESATSVKTADILNKYGDQIVNQYLVDNLALAHQLDVDDLLSSDGERVTDDIARKATGRLALQPIEVQRAFYEDVEAQYDALIEYLNKTNQNDLEPRTFDFDAKEVRTEILFDGPNKTTPFGEDAVYGEYSIKAQGVAMKPEEIQAAIAESLHGKTPADHASEMLANLDSQYKQFIEKLAQASRETAAVANADGEYDNTKHEAIGDTLFINKSIESAGVARQIGADFLRSHAIGKTFRVEINGEPYNAVITNVRNTHKTTGNPFSLSKFQITLAVNGALRSITVPATQFRKIEVSSIAPAFRIETLFKEQPANQRETAKIVTGNLLAAYGEIKGVRGTIISFTKADGTIEQGILLPKLFDFSKNTQGDYRLRSGADALKFLQKSTNKDIGRFGIATRDGQVRVLPRGDGVQVRVPKSKAQGARYFLDKNLIAVAGDFVSSANAMVANVDDAASAEKVLDMLMDKQALYALPSMADEAKSMASKPGPDGGAASFSRAPAAAPSRADSNARNVATQMLVDGLKAKWTRAPEIIVARNMQDAQIPQAVRDYDLELKSQGATGEARGFIYKGKVYLLSDELKGPQQIAEVLFHEVLGHYGLRGAFGDSLNSILQQMGTMRRRDVVAKAREYGLFDKDALGGLDKATASDSQIWAAMSAKDRLSAAEEVLAEMAQTQPTIGFVQRAIAAIRNWLRANVPGFDKLALTDADIVQAYILPARGYVTRSQETGAQSLERAMRDAGFSRAPAGDQTQTENFRRWFGDSKVVDADGNPLRVYHGTSGDFSSFATDLVNYFSADASAASVYAEGFGKPRKGANVLPVYLSIKNPKWMPLTDSAKLTAGDLAALKADGFDGVFGWVLDTGMGGVTPIAREVGTGQRGMDKIVTEAIPLHPAQVKSAIGNRGTFDPADQDIRFSRADMGSRTGMASKARDELNRTFSAPGKLSWWHKSVGTMYNLAERSPVFKRVFDSAQGFVDDVSHYATDAAELAPKLLPKLETWRDIAKRPISAADNAAVAKPVFEGTLDWARDEAGKPVRLQVLLDAAEKLTPEQKAQRLLRQNKIGEGMLKAWQGLPLEQYEKLVASRYESQMLKAGIVWTPAELKAQFKLNDAQVALYQEFRAATDRSLDTMARSDMLRFGGEDVKDLADMVMDAKDAQDAAQILRDHLQMLAKENPDRAGAIGQLADGMLDRAARVQELQEQGYAPLSRFGKYTVDVMDAGGERQYFGLFETAREANIMAMKMRKGFGQDAVTQGTLSDEEFKLLAGITPESLELFGNMLGLDATGDDAQDQAFQEYLRRTKTNRSAMRRLIHRQGIAGYSEDVGRVLASFIYSNARQTSAGLHMGDLGEAITAIPKQQGELKDAAIQLSEYVKNPQEEAQMVRGLLFAQYLGGSIASAVVNMTQPVAVSFPWLSQFGGAKQAATELGRAAKNLASRGHRYEADLAAALKLAEEEGTVSPQEVHQLMAQARGSGSLRPGDGTRAGDARAAAGNALTRLSLGWGKVFGAAEQVNRRMTFIAAYRVAKAQGMANPAAFAKKAVVETQFVYSKANKMKWGRGAVGATVMTFKTYSIAYIELLHRMYTQGGPEGKQAVLLALAVLMLMGGAGGLPFAEDAEDLVDGLAQMMGYNFNSKKAKQELLESVFGEAGAGFVERGITGLPGMPLDVSGRLGMGNLLPGTGIFKEKTDHTRDVLELVGPVGDLAKRVASGGRAILTGDVGAGLLQVSPVAVRNAAKGADMAARGMYRDDKGYKVLDTTPAEALMKSIGFQPASVSKVQEANFINQQAKNFYSMQANEIRALWARGIFEQNQDLVEDARARVEDWNRKNPDQRMVIAMPAVFKRVREMSKTKDQRIADTAPKAMRQALREESARARAAQ